MANEFTSLSNAAASEKITLTRIEIALSIIDYLTLVSGYIYEMIFSYDSLYKIEILGFSLTRVSSSPGTFEYTFNEETRLLVINFGEPIDYYLLTKTVIASYYIFLANNERGHYTYQDPMDNTSPMRYWDARMSGNPSFLVDQADIIDGFLSIGSTSVQINNEDNFFQQHLGTDNSLSQREVSIWQCLDSVENIRKLYSGYCSSISISGRVVNIAVDDAFINFNRKYLCLGDIDNSTYRNSPFSASDENKDKSILKLFCLVTRTFEGDRTDNLAAGYLFTPNQGNINFTEAYQAVNILYTTSRTTSTNRRWAACVETLSSSDKTDIVAGAVDSTVGGITLKRISVPDAKYYRPGCNITINSVVGYYVWEVDFINNYIFVNGNKALIANGQTIFRPSISVVQVRGADINGRPGYASLQYGTHYTIINVGGVRCIQLANNFEAAFPFTGDLVNGIFPDNEVTFRAWNHDDLNHAVVLQEIIENAGMAIDATSFADAALEQINCNFTLPNWGQTQAPSIQEAVRSILMSTFSHLSISDNFEISYFLFKAIGATSPITENDMLKGSSLDQEIDYKDICNEVYYANIHGESMYNDRLRFNRYSNTYEPPSINYKARYLHNVIMSKTITHVLTDMGYAKDKIMAVLSNRRATFTMKTKGVNFDSNIGNDFRIESSKAIGSGLARFKAMTIQKDAAETTIKGVDLLGL